MNWLNAIGDISFAIRILTFFKFIHSIQSWTRNRFFARELNVKWIENLFILFYFRFFYFSIRVAASQLNSQFECKRIFDFENSYIGLSTELIHQFPLSGASLCFFVFYISSNGRINQISRYLFRESISFRQKRKYIASLMTLPTLWIFFESFVIHSW